MNVRARRFTPLWWVTLPWTARDIYRRLTPPDPTFHAMSYWWHGSLQRRPIDELTSSAAKAELTIVNPGVRDPGTSVTLFELNCILMLMISIHARRVLEIGTFDGNTTLNLARNLPDDGEVVTIDLPIDAPVDLALTVNTGDRNITERQLVGAQFVECAAERAKIKQVFGDSALINFTSLGGPFDFAFIDGCHAYNYVKSDTNNVLKIMRRGGLVVWHDYAMMESVSRAVDEFRDSFRSLCAVELTRLAVGVVK